MVKKSLKTFAYNPYLQILAEFLSFLFHPLGFILLMPFFVIFRGTSSGLYALKWAIFSAAFVGVGILVFLYGRIHGNYSDIDLSNRKERSRFYLYLWPLLFVYLAIAIFFRGVFFPLSIISIGIIVGLLLYELINLKIKASIHVGVACGFVLSMGILFGYTTFFVLLPIIPVVIWSRLYLKKHTFPEAIAGLLLGMGVTLVTFTVGRLVYTI